MIKLGLSIEEDDAPAVDDLPPLEEEVDRALAWRRWTRRDGTDG